MDKARTQQRGQRQLRRGLLTSRLELLLIIVVSLTFFSAFAEQPSVGAEGASGQPAAAIAAPATPAATSDVSQGVPPSEAAENLPRPEPQPALSASPPALPGAQSASTVRSAVGPLPDAMSPWGMFVQADVVVKIVMIGLALASAATWTVLLVKTIQLRAARREGRRALATVLSARSLLDAARQIADQRNAVGRLLAAAEDEVEKSQGLPAEGIKERIAWQLERIEAAA